MIAAPDSRLARDADERARTALTPALYAHSLRAFHLGARAGDVLRVGYDREALFAAALLHDLGLAGEPDPERTFELVGADLARALVDAHAPDIARRVWDAIAMHTVPHLARANGGEALLVHLGAAADVFGARLPLAQDEIVELEAHYPRGTLAAELTMHIAREADVHRFGQFAAFRALGLAPLER